MFYSVALFFTSQLNIELPNEIDFKRLLENHWQMAMEFNFSQNSNVQMEDTYMICLRHSQKECKVIHKVIQIS